MSSLSRGWNGRPRIDAMTRTVIAVVALCLATLGVPLSSQTTQDSPRFDAASIKPNTSGSNGVDALSSSGQLRAINVSLMWLLGDAYELQDFQVVGAPPWAARDRFDVMARASGVDAALYRPMLRTLLAERFGLVAHKDTRELPVYALMPVQEGRLGPKLEKSKIDCATAERTGGFCGTDTNNRSMRGGSLRMSELASTLSPWVGRTVFDRTGLAGEYDFTLTWTSDVRRSPSPGDDGPSIFTALQEQLGLKLDSQRGPVEVLVIDRVQQPTAD
jgi:uncharacterized protein (TIGR03435 family)